MEDLRVDLMDVENRAEWRRRTPHPRDLNQPEGERERQKIVEAHVHCNTELARAKHIIVNRAYSFLQATEFRAEPRYFPFIAEF